MKLMINQKSISNNISELFAVGLIIFLPLTKGTKSLT